MAEDNSAVTEYFRAHGIRTVLDAFVADYTRQLHAQRERRVQVHRYAHPQPQCLTNDVHKADEVEGLVASPVTALRMFLSRYRDHMTASASSHPYALLLVEDEPASASDHVTTTELPAMKTARALAERLATQTGGRVCDLTSALQAGNETDGASPTAKATGGDAAETADEHMRNDGAVAVGPAWLLEEDDKQARQLRRQRQCAVAAMQHAQFHPQPPACAATLYVGQLSTFPCSVGDALAMEEVLGAPRAVLVLHAAAGDSADTARDAEADGRQRQRLASGAGAPGWMQDLTRPSQLTVLSREIGVQAALLRAGAGTATAGLDDECRRETEDTLRALSDANKHALLAYYEAHRRLQSAQALDWQDAEYMEVLTGGFLSALQHCA